MGTRGVVGFRIDGVDKLAYNHSDSYPSWLGVRILIQAQEMYAAGRGPLRASARNIKMLSDDDVTQEIVEATRIARLIPNAIYSGKKYGELIAEVEKCVVLCSSCHRIEHSVLLRVQGELNRWVTNSRAVSS